MTRDDDSMPRRRNWVFAVALGLLLSGCSTETEAIQRHTLSEAPAEGIAFDQYEVVTGTAARQTVLTGFLLGDAIAELAVVHIDEEETRHLRIFAFGDGTWVPNLDATLRPEASFVDVARIGGRDRLVTYEPGHLYWFDPESATHRPLMAVNSSFNPPRGDEIPHVDVTRDLNDDGRDDLVVPDVDGFSVFIQLDDGTFADPVTVGRATDMRGIYGADGYRYDPWSHSRIHRVDYDTDGRSDLVFWSEDHFEVHLQAERGLFAAESEAFTTDVAFDSDDLFALATGRMTGRVLHSLTDLNGDGVADLVVVSLEGDGISNKRSTYEVHLGTPAPDDRIAFATDVDIAFRSPGSIQLGMDRLDLDRDGQIDLMFTTIDLQYLEASLWKSIKGTMGDDIWLQLEFYPSQEGRYPDEAATVRRIALDGVPSNREPGSVPLDIVLRGATHERRKTQAIWPRAFNSTLLIGDVTGDGLSDLIIGQHPRHLDLLVGVPGPGLFSPQPQDVAVAVPNDAEYTWLVDLDRDGTQDILMHSRFTLRDAHGAPVDRPGPEPQRVTMLIAR
jgi:hypothetical protein